MNKNSTFRDSQTNWDYIDSLQEQDIDLSDIPQVTADQMARAVLRINGSPVSEDKVQVTMLLDAAVVAYFKAQAGEHDYQILINETLKRNIRECGLETILRRVIREELAAYQPDPENERRGNGTN